MQRILSFCLALVCLTWAAPAVHAQSAAFAPQALTGFSKALAVDGDRVFAGEPDTPHTPGRVYIFTPSDDGWAEEAYLQAADGTDRDGFGSALAVQDGHLAVGAEASNAAYVFEEGDAGWTQVARVTPSDSVDSFGTSVALSGDVLFVGAAPSARSRSASTGAVYVFERQDDGSFMEVGTLAGSDTVPGARFGATLSTANGRLLVGAPGQETGAVYAFHRADDGAWSEKQILTAGSPGDRFGSAVQAAGDHVLIGAPRALSTTGTAYAFHYDAEADVWKRNGQLLPFDGQSSHLFGQALAFDGTRAWVGAPGAEDRAGMLYRFDRTDDGWTTTTRVSHSGAESGDMLGATVAASGSIAAAGLLGDDFRAGTLAIFSQDGDAWTASPALAPSSEGGLAALTGDRRSCSDGSVEGFDCKQMDLMAFLPVDEIGGGRGVQVNDIWGWTDPETGNEYALVGRVNGLSVVDVSNPTNPVYIGNLPMTEGAEGSVWRDMKVYQNHAYIVADNAGDHGMQVLDLTQVRDLAPEDLPVTFEQAAHYDKVNSAHNVVINTDTGYAYIVGAGGGGETCGGGLHMVNIQEPTKPTFEGCFADPSTGRTGTGYSHDAQCVVYNGPDADYQGREICLGANETAISIADVTDKDNPVAVSTASYPNHAYVHQGWLTEDHRYFYVNDELDEINGLADRTRTLIWDLADLDDPQLVREYFLSEPSTDHNLYVKGNTMYQSNYVSGLRVLDVSNPESPEEVGHFDTVPWGDNSAGFGGSWSNYPYFESGTIVMTSMDEGLFVLKKSKTEL